MPVLTIGTSPPSTASKPSRSRSSLIVLAPRDVLAVSIVAWSVAATSSFSSNEWPMSSHPQPRNIRRSMRLDHQSISPLSPWARICSWSCSELARGSGSLM